MTRQQLDKRITAILINSLKAAYQLQDSDGDPRIGHSLLLTDAEIEMEQLINLWESGKAAPHGE